MNREPPGGLGPVPTRAQGYKHRASECPGCGHTLNATSDPKQRGMPRPKDLTICVTCGTVLRFDALLHLEAVTLAELDQLPPATLEELKEQQDRYRGYHGGNPLITLPPRKPT